MSYIDIQKESLKNDPLPDQVTGWMDTYADKHDTMLAEWKKNPDTVFATDFHVVVMCIQYEARKARPRKIILQRLLGRARKLRNELEDEQLLALFDPTEDVLACLR